MSPYLANRKYLPLYDVVVSLLTCCSSLAFIKSVSLFRFCSHSPLYRVWSLKLFLYCKLKFKS